MVIQQTGDSTFNMQRGAHDMTLTKEGDRWVMYTVNPAVRAWNRGFATPKFFPTLAAVEAKYKSWRGVSALIG